MKIGIIGAGNIGSAVARLFVNSGHHVAIANSRGPETLDPLIQELGDNATAASVDDAIAFGEIIFISIPFGKINELPVNGFDGKIVIDSNNYYPDRDGKFPELDDDSSTSSEMLERHLGGARLVKAFNTIWSEHLKTQGNKELPLENRRAIFIAGDDTEAKAVVAKLIEDIGFAAVDTGFLADGGRSQQPGMPIYNQELTPAAAAAVLSRQL